MERLQRSNSEGSDEPPPPVPFHLNIPEPNVCGDVAALIRACDLHGVTAREVNPDETSEVNELFRLLRVTQLSQKTKIKSLLRELRTAPNSLPAPMFPTERAPLAKPIPLNRPFTVILDMDQTIVHLFEPPARARVSALSLADGFHACIRPHFDKAIWLLGTRLFAVFRPGLPSFLEHLKQIDAEIFLVSHNSSPRVPRVAWFLSCMGVHISRAVIVPKRMKKNFSALFSVGAESKHVLVIDDAPEVWDLVKTDRVQLEGCKRFDHREKCGSLSENARIFSLRRDLAPCQFPDALCALVLSYAEFPCTTPAEPPKDGDEEVRPAWCHTCKKITVGVPGLLGGSTCALCEEDVRPGQDSSPEVSSEDEDREGDSVVSFGSLMDLFA